jgi:cell division protein FtsB
MALDPRRLTSRIVGGVVTSVALYYALWGGEYSAFDLGRIVERQQTEALRLAETRTELDSLRQIVEQLESDPAAIEAFARERFGMIREGETLYRFVRIDPEAENPAVAAPSRP